MDIARQMIPLLILAVFSMPAASETKKHPNDPHYIQVGFFDLHVCNWHDRKPFFLAVFSSYQYDQVKSVSVYTPNDKKVGRFDLNRFRIVEKKGKPRKKVFLTQMPLTNPVQNGWYRAEIQMKDGSSYMAKDLVHISIMPLANNRSPADDARDISNRSEFSWDPVPGAKYYKVYIRDLWDGERIIHSSKLLRQPRYVIPANVLQPGGFYSWRIHARDTNEDPEVGDFNHGSLTDAIEFSVAQ
jgi:hypothetical protein